MLGYSLPLFRVLGIRLELHWTFLLLVGFFGIQGFYAGGPAGAGASLLVIFLIFSSVLLHELGHCLAARPYHIRVSRILLLPIGGMAQFENIPRQPKAELIITGAGPLVNFAIVLITLLIHGIPRDLSFLYHPALNFNTILGLLFYVNLLMGVFNLLPVFPMDGGRILRALLAYRISYLHATQWAIRVSRCLIVVGILLALFYLHNYLLAALFVFIWIGGDLEYQQLREKELYTGLQIRNVTIPVTEVPSNTLDQQGLQGSWPLELFARQLLADKTRLHPVFEGTVFLGILDPARIEDMAEKQAKNRVTQPSQPR